MRIVATHKNTDFDALASMIAVTLLDPQAKPVLSKHINPNVKTFLSIHKTSFDLVSPDEPDWSLVKTLPLLLIPAPEGGPLKVTGKPPSGLPYWSINSTRSGSGKSAKTRVL